ncbi:MULTISPECIES: S1C family serine protease [Natrialbaceae]|uniref:S1C family serine protease n=1 Tax=Natrialbaceae TaxID=1644061 RepID=UPI00207CE542|nr:S1C family serine protease [Natronococcus sp. CG52]
MTSVDEAREAVVRIGTERTGAADGDEPIPATGSGFVIDPSGIVVTNSHVVTGVDSLDVSVGRARTSPDAAVLGTAECADLAVLELAGEGYTPLAWYGDEPERGLDVWALGFPDGDSYAPTEGTITGTTETANAWVAVDAEIEHTADLLGGNSGGPLVTADGRVVGVNYAATNPFAPVEETERFAIGATVAREAAETVRRGAAPSSIGIHGIAVPTDDRCPAGIRVSSVESDSPAGAVGVRPGDVLTAIANAYVGRDGTVREYCAALDARDLADDLPLQVYRDGKLLEGVLNGRALEPVIELSAPALARSDEPYAEYTTLTDETGTIWVDVPAEWTDRHYRRADVGPSLIAAPDIERFLTTFETPGLWILGSAALDRDADWTLAELRHRDCTATEPIPYDDGLYTGVTRLATDCGDPQSTIVTIVAEPRDRSFAIVVFSHLVADRDRDALERVLAAFHHRDRAGAHG